MKKCSSKRQFYFYFYAAKKPSYFIGYSHISIKKRLFIEQVLKETLKNFFHFL